MIPPCRTTASSTTSLGFRPLSKDDGSGAADERRHRRPETRHDRKAQDRAATALQGGPDQRRLHAARVRGPGAEGGVPHHRGPGLPHHDDGASTRRLRRGDLHARRRREQSQGRHRHGPPEGLSADVLDRAGGVGARRGRHSPRRSAW